MTAAADGSVGDAAPAGSGPRAAIVTVSYNSGDVLPAFLASVPAASAGAVPVVVADNDSTDADALRAVTEAAGARFLALGENRGYGGAVNRAVATLGPEVRWVLVSNPDVVLEPGGARPAPRDCGGRPGHRRGRSAAARTHRRGVPVRPARPVPPDRPRARGLRERLARQPLDPAVPPGRRTRRSS
ncbi:glycosyltransferase family 2 protein [Curtobacterium sp. MCPF17_052]|uniref:glycosyltransferase family 2 protein n=1 Tax=Curtobacterium sp. MCPF17_052 TaxID=2175655 RepID=UPI0024E0146B|nr:glycosyltransferase [Curtobacterium sp. MCPF17_052]WIB13016.1 glycosyltransferase [Curtobacterium sp. MCPF17_052]